MSRGGDIRQQVVVELEGIGGDTVSILAQAERELNAEVARSVEQFDKVDGNATKLLGSLKKLAAQFVDLGKVAQSTQDFVAKLNADMAKRNDDLAKRDAEEAKLDAAAKKRLDDKAARDQKSVNDAVASSEKLIKAKEKEAAAIAAAAAKEAQETRDSANQQIADEARLQAALGAMEARDNQVRAQQATDEMERIQKVRDADIKALGDRAQARAKFERQVDDAIKSNRQAEGDAMKARIDGYVRAETSTKAWNDAQEKLAASTKGGMSATEKAANESKRFGQNMMSVAYAMDDVRYGFGAVVNNIPMLAMAAGASALWAANIAIVGIGVYELGKFLAPVVKDMGLLDQGVKHFVPTVEELQEKLKSLEGIKIKLPIDYQSITNARRELARLTEEQSTYNALKGKKTKEQQKRSEIVQEAIIEGGGGTDFDSSAENITKAVEERITREDAEVSKVQEYIAERRRRIAESTDPGTKNRAFSDIASANAKLNGIREAISAKAISIVGGAGSGRELERSQLESMLASGEEDFSRRGIDVSRLGAGLEMARKPNLFADEREKHAKEIQDREDKAAQIDKDAKAEARDQLKQTEDKRKKEAEVAAKKLDREGVSQDERVRQGEEAAADIVRDVDHWFEQRAKKGADPAREAAIAARFRQLNRGASPQQAAYAAHEMDSMIQSGKATPQQAYSTVREKMLQEIQRLNMNVLEMRAQQEQDNGFFGEASMMLQQMNSKIGGVGMNMNRAPTRAMSFTPMINGGG